MATVVMVKSRRRPRQLRRCARNAGKMRVHHVIEEICCRRGDQSNHYEEILLKQERL